MPKKDNFQWLSERISYLTNNDLFKQINAGNVNYIPTFRAGAWTILKELALAYYAPSYLRIIRKQNWVQHVSYLDLFSGSGLIEIENLKKKYFGSPLVITNCVPLKFDSYYFFEKDSNMIAQLQKLIQIPNAKFYQGDCNEKINDIIPIVAREGSHSLIFVDPFAMEIDFETINKLGDIECDIIMTVATEEILRSTKQWFSNQSWRSDTLNKFFGDENWKRDLLNVDSDEEIFDYYSKKIVKETSKKKPISSKIQKTIDGHHYFILFTSTGGFGKRPEFFDIIHDFNRRIDSIGGEEILSYLQNYVESRGRSIIDWSQ